MNNYRLKLLIIFCCVFSSCATNNSDSSIHDKVEWERNSGNPILRDVIANINYEVASDPHVFRDESDNLKMIYTGDNNDHPSIKMASGSSVNDWQIQTTLLNEVGPSGKDINKETAFYRRTPEGKHQIYYIGYEDEETYQSEIYLAEADQVEGPYTQFAEPVVPRGNIAGENVYLITSPSVVEHEGILYMTFIGWNASPNEVTEVWVIGTTSANQGHTWSGFQKVDARIGMEGQLTKIADGEFVAVRTGEYKNGEAIFYATANHPFGPWREQSEPVLVQADPSLEKDEIIAPQIFYDKSNNKQYLYYTGADHQKGWWIMLAEKR